MNNTTTRPHVVIAGGSGFLGRGLAQALVAHGYTATILSRSPEPTWKPPPHVRWRQWDAQTVGDWAACLDGAAALVNLVGRSVDCRKTPQNQRVILASRVASCRALGEAMRSRAQPPPVWVQSATAHIVGDPQPEDTICDESTPPGPLEEMAPRVGVAWEQAFGEAKLPEQRGVVLRISFVLGAGGGAMARLSRLTRLGLGGTVGSGKQWISWLHQDDLNRLIRTAIEDERYAGVYMTTAPEPVTNRAFMRAMRRAYRRPWSPPAPAFAIRLACRFALDTDPELALLGRRCVPTRLLEEHGFTFRYPTIDEALRDLVARERCNG